MKKIIIIGCLFSILLILTGCMDKSNMVTNDIEGTLESVELVEIDLTDFQQKIKVTFGNNSFGILILQRYDTDGVDWYEILIPHIGENIKLTWIMNYQKAVIAYVQFQE